MTNEQDGRGKLDERSRAILGEIFRKGTSGKKERRSEPPVPSRIVTMRQPREPTEEPVPARQETIEEAAPLPTEVRATIIVAPPVSERGRRKDSEQTRAVDTLAAELAVAIGGLKTALKRQASGQMSTDEWQTLCRNMEQQLQKFGSARQASIRELIAVLDRKP